MRDAFETSVACTPPPVSCHSSHVSTVPNASPPAWRRLAQDPLELRRREVRIGREPGARPDRVGGQLAATLRGAPVLPDDRGMHRLAAVAVPDDRRLALVRDPDGVELGRAETRVCECRGRSGLDARPELARILLDPAGLRCREADARVAAADDLELVADDEAGRSGRPLVDGEDHTCISRLDVGRARGYALCAESARPGPRFLAIGGHDEGSAEAEAAREEAGAEDAEGAPRGEAREGQALDQRHI